MIPLLWMNLSYGEAPNGGTTWAPGYRLFRTGIMVTGAHVGHGRFFGTREILLSWSSLFVPKREKEFTTMSRYRAGKDRLSKTNERPFGMIRHIGVGVPRQGARLNSYLGATPPSPGWELRRSRLFRATVSLVKKPNTGETALCSCDLHVRILAAEGAGHCMSCGRIVYPRNVEDELTENMSRALLNGSVELEVCGCIVEPDGKCHHGNESPLLEAGLI